MNDFDRFGPVITREPSNSEAAIGHPTQRSENRGGLTRRGKAALALAGLATAVTAAKGLNVLHDHNTIHIPSGNEPRRVYTVGDSVTTRAISKSKKEFYYRVTPTTIAAISRYAYPGEDYRDLAAELTQEVVAYNEAHDYQGDPHTLQRGTPLILPVDAQIGRYVDPSEQGK